MRLVEIKNTILESEYHHRSTMVQVVSKLTTTNIFDFCEMVLNTAAGNLNAGRTLTTSCFIMGQNICNSLGVPENSVEATFLKTGIEGYNWLARVGLLDVEKYLTIKSEHEKAKETWYVSSTSKEFTEYCQQFINEKSFFDPTTGPKEWTTAVMKTDSKHITIVKKADYYSMLDLYDYDSMPRVYHSLNRLNEQTYVINEKIAQLCQTDFNFIPRIIPEQERKEALYSLNDVSRKARWVEEIRFKEMNKWLLEEAGVDDEKLAKQIAKKRAAEKSKDFFDEKSEYHTSIISDVSKRDAFEKIRTMSSEWLKADLNFIYQMDTRGRIYTTQQYLSPLGSDLAKAMLLFADEHQVSGFDLCIHIANCFGQDKLSFEQRVEWVNENRDKLYAIGEDPLENYNYIKELELCLLYTSPSPRDS